MIICPRCGFEQPRDKFCAKCGVLMVTYVKKQPSLLSRLTSSFSFYAVIIALVVTSTIFMIYKRGEKQPEFFPEKEQSASRIEPQAREQIQLPQTQSIQRPAVQDQAAKTSPRALTPQQPTQISEPATAPARTADQQPPVAQKTSQEPNAVQIKFISGGRETLERLNQDSEGKLDIGRYAAAVVPQIKAKLEGLSVDKNYRVLSQEAKSITPGSAAMIFAGGKEPKTGEAIGFFVEVTKSEKPEYRISIRRSLPEFLTTGEPKITSQNVDDETASVAKGAGLAISGLLPRKPLVEGEEELYRSNVLKLLTEPAFFKGDEEFLILIVPQYSDVQ